MTTVSQIKISEIQVKGKRRPLNKEKQRMIAESMSKKNRLADTSNRPQDQ